MRILDWLRKNKESQTQTSSSESEARTEEIEVKKKLFGGKEEYIGGRKLTGEFLADIQRLARDYTLDDLKKYLKIAREKYKEKKEYGELFTKILFATILKVGGINSEYIHGHSQRRIILNDDIITRIAEELYTDKETAKKMAYAWREKLNEWIRNLYVVGDLYPGYGWSSFTYLVDHFSSLRRKMEEETKERLSILEKDINRLLKAYKEKNLEDRPYLYTKKRRVRLDSAVQYLMGKLEEVEMSDYTNQQIRERLGELKNKLQEIYRGIHELYQSQSKEENKGAKILIISLLTFTAISLFLYFKNYNAFVSFLNNISSFMIGFVLLVILLILYIVWRNF